MSLKTIVEEALKNEKWKDLKSSQESQQAVKVVSTNKALRTQLKSNMSDTASYKKRVVSDCLLNVLNYDKLISKNTVKTENDKQERAYQVEEAKLKLLKRRSGTGDYQMGWWRRCQQQSSISYGSGVATVAPPLETPESQFQAAQGSIEQRPVSQGSEQLGGTPPMESSGQAEEDKGDEVDKPEDQYGLVRNDAAKYVWNEFVASLSTAKKDDEGKDQDPVEFSILQLARLDAWIMTVINCPGLEELRGGTRQKKYVETFHKFLPIAKDQLTREMYEYVEDWEEEDLEVPGSADEDSIKTDEERMSRVYGKKYIACIPVYVPSLQTSFLSVRSEWMNRYVGFELGRVYDCNIAEFSKDHRKISMLTSSTEVDNDSYDL